MIAAWAKDWGLKGYEHLDPQFREQQKQQELKRRAEKARKAKNENS